MRRRSLHLLLGPALAAGLLLSACSGDDGDDGAAATTAASALEDAADGAAGTGTTAVRGTASTTDGTATSTTGGAAGPREAFCDDWDGFEDLTDDLPDDTIEDVRSGFDRVLAAMRQAEANAPAEIADDFATMITGFEDVVAMAQGSASLEALEQQLDDFDDSAIDPAGEAIDDWYDEHC